MTKTEICYSCNKRDEPEWKGKDLSQLPGSLVQLSPDGTRTTLVSASEGLLSATGITVSADNQIYITKRGVGINGEVIKVDRSKKVPEPASVIGLIGIGVLGINSLQKRKRQEKLCEDLLSKVEIL